MHNCRHARSDGVQYDSCTQVQGVATYEFPGGVLMPGGNICSRTGLTIAAKYHRSPCPMVSYILINGARLLEAASKSRCRSLYPVVMLAINTGMRVSEIRGLRWSQVDFLANSLAVGKSKTTAGTGRVIPLNARSIAVLSHWHGLFPEVQPEHYVFSHEKYGLAGNDRKQCAYEIIPTEPMHRWKVAWESTRKAANVPCRFHDLRHTFISRLAEPQASDSTVMALAGHVSRAIWNATRTFGWKPSGRPWTPSVGRILSRMWHKIGHSCFGKVRRG